MTVRARLALGFLATAMILVVPLLVSMRSLEHLDREVRALRDGEFAASLLLGRLREALNELRRQETALLFVPDNSTRDAMADAVGTVDGLTDSLEHHALLQSAQDIRGAVEEITIWAQREYEAALTGRVVLADTISTQRLGPALGRADRAVLIAERDLRERTRSRVAGAATAIAETERVAVIAMLLALLVATALAIWLTRSITHPVRELDRGMRSVADGELDYAMPELSARPDEFGRLATSFDVMTRRLTELDRLKAEFVSVASHELKTPVNVIIGYLALLGEGVYGQVNDDQRTVLKTIEQQAQGLNRLVRQLLDVSRFEAGGGRLEPRRIELRGFIGDLQRAFGVLAHQQGVGFEVVTRDSAPREVVWDVDRMNEVLGNLLSNAFKFTPRAGCVSLTAEGADHAVRIDVRDTGAGIPPEQLPRVFDKFYQAANQDAAAHGGSGLGLAIAKQIVDAHHGTITCESAPGAGTLFRITMPAEVSGRRSSMGTPIIREAV